MNIQSDDFGSWFNNLREDIKPEYSAIKVTSPLSFYKLKGRITTLAIDNLTPIENVAYSVFSAKENRYYKKEFRNYPVETFFWYRPSITFSGDDPAIESLRRYIMDGNVHLLLTAEQVEDISDMLKRLWKAKFKTEGKLDYRTYIELLDQSLRLEDYKDYGSNLIGYKTVVNQFELRIEELWQQAHEKK